MIQNREGVLYTNEAIVDPVAYIQANPEIVQQVPNNSGAEGLVISAPDFDVMVSKMQFEPGDEIKRYEVETGDVLGALYRNGSATVPLNIEQGTTASARYYPSPRYVNNLVERLDLRPGEDVLRFAHAVGYDDIPGPVYAKHLQAGEFPQSAGRSSNHFAHDRGSDHAPGVILAPKEFTQRAIHMATLYDKYQDTRHISKEFNPVVNFDTASSDVGFVSSSLYSNIKAGEMHYAPERTLCRISRYMAYDYIEDVPYDHLKDVSGGYDEEARKAGELIFNHLLELAPKIVALQNEQAAIQEKK
jgi:hypothetical protein